MSYPRYLPTPSPLPFESDQKFSMPGRGLISSDDEEEEVVISGNLRKKTKKNLYDKTNKESPINVMMIDYNLC